MKLSIITINYNNAEGLERTLNSVLAQTYEGIEHIIVDGGSTDGSVDVIKRYVQKVESGKRKVESVLWVSEKDKGIYNAMNKGVKKATGDYIWILNSGDCVAAPNVVEKMMTILKDGKMDLLLGNIIRMRNNCREYAPLPTKRVKDDKPRQMDVSMLQFYYATVPQDAAFVKRELFELYGYFDETMKICADWKLYMNMIALGGVQPMYVNIDVVLFDMSGISNANNELRLAERKAYLDEVLPLSIRKDYDDFSFPIRQYQRLKRHHLWAVVNFIERVLFKLEKWHVLR